MQAVFFPGSPHQTTTDIVAHTVASKSSTILGRNTITSDRRENIRSTKNICTCTICAGEKKHTHLQTCVSSGAFRCLRFQRAYRGRSLFIQGEHPASAARLIPKKCDVRTVHTNLYIYTKSGRASCTQMPRRRHADADTFEVVAIWRACLIVRSNVKRSKRLALFANSVCVCV